MAGRGKGQAVVCLVLATALWGSAFVALKVSFQIFPPLWVIFARMVLGSAVFLLAWRWRGAVHYRSGDWKYLLGMAVCEPCLYFIFESMALQRTSAAQAGMITALLPLMVALVAGVFLRERVARSTLVGFCLAVVGAIWLSLASEAHAQAPAPLLGNFLEFLAMVTACGYVLLVKHLSTRYSAFLLTALQAFVGVLFFLPLALIVEPLPQAFPLEGVFAIVYLGVFVTVGAYGLYNYGLSQMPASQASGFINLIPVFTLLFAALLLDERLTLWQMLAAGLVFVGVLLSQWRGLSAPVPSASVLD